MIFLELHNRAVEDLLLYKFENAKNGMKHEKCDHILADFDGTVYRIRNVPNDKSKLVVSIILSFFEDLRANGADEVLRRDYAGYLLNQPDEGCSVSLLYDLDHLSDNYTQLAQQAAMLKRNCFAAAFERFFAFQALGEEAVGTKQAVIHYRPDESLYIRATGDRITVIFSTVFKELDDLIIAKVFLQELTEVRRRFDRAPQVLYSQSVPPAELQGTDAAVGDNVAYITFDSFKNSSYLCQQMFPFTRKFDAESFLVFLCRVELRHDAQVYQDHCWGEKLAPRYCNSSCRVCVLFPRHLTPSASPRTINLIHTLRNYLHYHIKCSKGYLHRRMHAKTTEFIKVLNRARPQCQTTPIIHTGGPGAKPSWLASSMSWNSEMVDSSCSSSNNNNNANGNINGTLTDDLKESSPELPDPPQTLLMNNNHYVI